MHALFDALARDKFIVPDVTLVARPIRRMLEASLVIYKASLVPPFEEDTQSFEPSFHLLSPGAAQLPNAFLPRPCLIELAQLFDDLQQSVVAKTGNAMLALQDLN